MDKGRIIQARGDGTPLNEGVSMQAQGKISLKGNWFEQTLQFRHAMTNLQRQAKFRPDIAIDPIGTLSAVSQMMAAQAIEIRKLQATVGYVVKKAGVEMPPIEEIMKAEAGSADGNGEAGDKVKAVEAAKDVEDVEDLNAG